MKYIVYILMCSDSSLYTGYTTDVERRVLEHNSDKKGAKYTSGRRPVTLLYTETCGSMGEAMSREYEIKKYRREQKLELVKKKTSK